MSVSWVILKRYIISNKKWNYLCLRDGTGWDLGLGTKDYKKKYWVWVKYVLTDVHNYIRLSTVLWRDVTNPAAFSTISSGILASGNNSCKLLILSADPFWHSLFSFSTILTWIYSVVVDGLPCSAFFYLIVQDFDVVNGFDNFLFQDVVLFFKAVTSSSASIFLPLAFSYLSRTSLRVCSCLQSSTCW